MPSPPGFRQEEHFNTLAYPLALAAGVLLALSFPKYGHPAVAWIALVPLLVALAGRPIASVVERAGRRRPSPGQPPLRAFLLGLVAGIVYFVGTIYWTSTVVATFGQLPTPVAIFAMLLLAAYLALYPAIAALVTSCLIAPDRDCRRCSSRRRRGWRPSSCAGISSAGSRGCRSATAR